MAFKVEELMTKIIPGASPGPRIWACPDDSRDPGCQDDSRSPGCQDDSRGQCPDDSHDQGCPDDSNIPPNCPDDTRHPHQAAGHGREALALLQRHLRERLDSAPEARI
jgi:hypothetical protein